MTRLFACAVVTFLCTGWSENPPVYHLVLGERVRIIDGSPHHRADEVARRLTYSRWVSDERPAR